uniref:Uncharacterized protein n=1 Tax=Oryza glumipatula TaxID=40148 RepID=A0A0D9YKL7_9ORYZ
MPAALPHSRRHRRYRSPPPAPISSVPPPEHPHPHHGTIDRFPAAAILFRPPGRSPSRRHRSPPTRCCPLLRKLHLCPHADQQAVVPGVGSSTAAAPLCRTQTVPSPPKEDEVQGLIAHAVKKLRDKPLFYVDYVRKKIDIARVIGLITAKEMQKSGWWIDEFNQLQWTGSPKNRHRSKKKMITAPSPAIAAAGDTHADAHATNPNPPAAVPTKPPVVGVPPEQKKIAATTTTTTMLTSWQRKMRKKLNFYQEFDGYSDQLLQEHPPVDTSTQLNFDQLDVSVSEMDRDELTEQYPFNILEDGEVITGFEKYDTFGLLDKEEVSMCFSDDTIDWFFHPDYCTLAGLDDYQRLVPKNKVAEDEVQRLIAHAVKKLVLYNNII